MLEEQEQKIPQPQLSDEDFSFPEPEITEEKEATQVDVTMAESNVTEEEKPLVGEPEESEEKPKPKVEDKPDFVKTMRDSNLEVFTKESFTNDTDDEEFSRQLIADKYLGEQTYTKEIDYTGLEYYPSDVEEDINKLKESVARNVANLSPEELKTISSHKGGDELVYNKYLSMANDYLGEATLTGGLAGVSAALLASPVIGPVAVGGAFISGAMVAIGSMYTGAEVADAVSRAQRTSPEEVEGMNKTELQKSAPQMLAETETAKEIIGDKHVKFFKELVARDVDDSPEERYAKEFANIALNGAMFQGVRLGLGGASKLASNAVDAVGEGAAKFKQLMPVSKKSTSGNRTLDQVGEELADLILIQKTIKNQNKRLMQSKKSIQKIISDYEGEIPPIPQKLNAVDHDKIAAKYFDELQAGGFKDENSYNLYMYHSAKGSNHTMGTKLAADLPKDASQEALSKLDNVDKYGKGSEGTGTVVMDFAKKIDTLGTQRMKAIEKGDTVLASRLEQMQNHIFDRTNVLLTQGAGNLQEVNRSMPFRKQIKELQDQFAANAIQLENKSLTRGARLRLEKQQKTLSRRVEIANGNMEGATNTELAAMAITNTIYSNMLSGAAIGKAALGGLVSTATNSAALLQQGVKPSTVFKMQMNNAKRVVKDARKLDLKELKSDIVSGSINNRFKSKNVQNLTYDATDTTAKKGLKKLNKVTNVLSSPIQGGLGVVDYMVDTFNANQRAVESWLEYSKAQQKAGRSSEDLIKELNSFLDDSSKMSDDFYNQVLKPTQEGLATDKMMLKKANSKNYWISKPAWGIDQAFNATTNSIILDGIKNFVNPFTRTAASALDSIAQNTAIGMLRTRPPNEAFLKLTPRQLTGTAASFGLYYGLSENITTVPVSDQRKAGTMGLRSGIQIGGHQYPLSILGIYGEAIEKFFMVIDSLESSSIGDLDTSDASRLLGGLLEATTVTGMGRNLKDIAQKLMNISEGNSRLEVTKMIESFMPAGYMFKGAADLSEGSLAANPYLAKVFNEVETEYGNAKRRDVFGTPITEGETLEMDRGLNWVIDRKGADKIGLKVKKELESSGVLANPDTAGFKTDEGYIPYSSIKISGSYGTFSATMSPLPYATKTLQGANLRVSSATRNKALGVMSLNKKTAQAILDEEFTNLSYLDANTPEAITLRKMAMSNITALKAKMDDLHKQLSRRVPDLSFPKALNYILENGAPNISKEFDQKTYEVSNLMKLNRNMFGGNLEKQKKFFSRVNRVKDTSLFYNAVKNNLGSVFMKNSAEAVSAEIERIEKMKALK